MNAINRVVACVSTQVLRKRVKAVGQNRYSRLPRKALID